MPRVVALVAETVSVEVPDVVVVESVTLTGLKPAVGRVPPVSPPETATVKPTGPEKPKLFRVMVAVFEEPGTTIREARLVEMLKSTAWTVTRAEWDSEPLLLVTVTL